MKTLSQLSQDPRVLVRNNNALNPAGSCVVYWMQRAQRAYDNPALDTAIEAANILQKPLVVFFGLVPFYYRANERHYRFLVQGLADTAARLEAKGALFVIRPYPKHSLLAFCDEVSPCLVIGDENPLRQGKDWRQKVASTSKVAFWTVDADVVVPSRLLEKEQFAARTIRPRIHKLLPTFLVKPPEPTLHKRWELPRPFSREDDLLEGFPIDRSVKPVSGFVGGTDKGLLALETFLQQRLAVYDTDRNHPERQATSRLSPYLHFGQLGPRGIAWAALQQPESPARESFLEELIVRRELAINFVHYNANYDNFDGLETWAKKTLLAHKSDPRPYVRSEKQLENAETGDSLWNACQKEMVLTGYMQGYVRMYWGKKLLEWVEDPAEALQIANRLNDKYLLDGRDPNGYTGTAWAIGGKHDRAWGPERPIFGMIRYMSYASTSKKFDSRAYERRIERLST